MVFSPKASLYEWSCESLNSITDLPTLHKWNDKGFLIERGRNPGYMTLHSSGARHSYVQIARSCHRLRGRTRRHAFKHFSFANQSSSSPVNGARSFSSTEKICIESQVDCDTSILETYKRTRRSSQFDGGKPLLKHVPTNKWNLGKRHGTFQIFHV